MAKHLTDKEKKKIITDRVNGMSLRRIAEKYGCTDYAVRKTIKDNPDIAEKIAKKKEQNTLDMLAYMDARKDKAQDIIDRIFEAMADPDRVNASTMRDLATVAGILIDKFTATAQKKDNEEPVKIVWGR